MGCGFGFYRWGAWFGFGQIQFDRGITICLFKNYTVYPRGYNRQWLRVGR